MRRWLFNIGTVASFLLCVTTVALWVRSYWVTETIAHFYGPEVPRSPPTNPFREFTRHMVMAAHASGSTDVLIIARVEVVDYGGRYFEGDWLYEKFAIVYIYVPNQRDRVIHVPDYAVALFTLVLPVVWLISFVRRRRRKGYCGRCSYNLTGNTSGVCPECGTPVPTAEFS